MQSMLLKVLYGTSAAFLASTAEASIATPSEPYWQVVPGEQLADYRGGVDLGSLVANFAIQRVVEVDGVVVARMQIVISNLDNLGNGGTPTVTVSGPVAQLVQIMDTAGVAAAARAAQTLGKSGEPAGLASDNSPALTSARSGSGLITNGHDSPGSVAAGSNGGSISSSGSQSGSSAQLGNAVGTAVAAANGALSLAPSSSSSTSASAPGPANPIQTVAASVNGAAAAAVPSVAQSAPSGNGVVPPGTPIVVLPVANEATTPNTSLVTSRTIALGNTGQVAVLSDLPNATAITTAVQNEVRAATIQTQTTISATLSSLSSLNALNLALANQIRQQIAGGP